MKPVLIGIGRNKYNVLNSFAKQLGVAFNELGREVHLIDFDEKDLKAQLAQTMELNADFMVFFNSVGSDMLHSFINLLRIPFVSLMVDNPVYHLERLSGQVKSHLVTYVDHSYLRFHQKYLPPHLGNYFLAHAGSRLPEPVEDIEFAERPIPILFAGSYWNPDYYRQLLTEIQPPASLLVKDAVAEILEGDCKTIDDSLDRALKKKDLAITDIKENQKLQVLISNYIRSFRRTECLRKCAESDHEVHVIGDNWHKCPLKDQLAIHPEANFTRILELIGRAKILLNISAVVPEGSHERVFSGMLNGAAVLTDKNDYFGKILKAEENILFYDWKALDALPGKLNDWLGSPEKLQAVAAAGQKEATAKHSWKHRAEELIRHVEDYRRK
ncbi:MAG: glycosyltransferase family 1 protein [bacterium]|nr:glycosyltransferase family 1 protein [bacterium]